MNGSWFINGIQKLALVGGFLCNTGVELDWKIIWKWKRSTKKSNYDVTQRCLVPDWGSSWPVLILELDSLLFFFFFFVSMISYRISSIQIAPRIPKLIIVTDFISYLFISSSFEGALMLIWRAIASSVWALFAYLFFLTRNDLFVYFIRSFPFLSRNWSESAQEQSSKIRFVDRVAFRRVLKSALGWFVCESWLLLGSYFVVGNE